MDNFDWLRNKVSADLGVTFEYVAKSITINNLIMDYAKGIIYEYADLIKVLHDKVQADKTKQKGKDDAVF